MWHNTNLLKRCDACVQSAKYENQQKRFNRATHIKNEYLIFIVQIADAQEIGQFAGMKRSSF